MAYAALLVCVVGLSAVISAQPAAAAETDSVAIGPGNGTDQRVLEIVGTANGSRVAAQPYRVGVGSSVNNQRWVLELDVIVDIEITPVYRIRNVQTGKCLSRDGTNTNNAAVTIQPCSDAVNQLWTVPYGGAFGGTQLLSMTDYRCLDLAGGSTANGALTRVSNCVSNWYQRWRQRYGSYHCDLYSNQRFLTGLCVSTGVQPMFGLFSTFRNVPVSFGAGAATVPNALVNFIEVQSLNSQLDDAAVDGVEFGLHASYDPEAGTQNYYPYWVEWGENTEEYHGISGTPYGSAADGRLHHYLLLTNDDNTEWDVLYDYNTIASTRLQEGARFVNSYAITSVVYPNVVSTAEPFENRVQVWDGNRQWRRPRIGETSRSEPKTCHALPADRDLLWDQPNLPPWCMTTSLGTVSGADGNTEVQYLRVGTSNLAAAARPRPAQPAPAADVINGVNQHRLRACLEADQPCLETVPGLRACVAARKVCNTQTAEVAAGGGRVSKPMSPPQARQEISRRLGLGSIQATDSTVIAATVDTLSPGLRARISTAPVDGRTPVIVVAGPDVVTGLSSGSDRTYTGYTAVFNAATGELIYACLGQKCPATSTTGGTP